MRGLCRLCIVANQLLARDKPRGNRHRLQLLEQQLSCIGDIEMREAGCISASTARPYVLFRVCNRHQPAVFTGVTREGIRALHQPLFRKLRHSMRNDTVTLHFRLYLAPRVIYSPYHCYLSLEENMCFAKQDEHEPLL